MHTDVFLHCHFITSYKIKNMYCNCNLQLTTDETTRLTSLKLTTYM